MNTVATFLQSLYFHILISFEKREVRGEERGTYEEIRLICNERLNSTKYYYVFHVRTHCLFFDMFKGIIGLFRNCVDGNKAFYVKSLFKYLEGRVRAGRGDSGKRERE